MRRLYFSGTHAHLFLEAGRAFQRLGASVHWCDALLPWYKCQQELSDLLRHLLQNTRHGHSLIFNSSAALGSHLWYFIFFSFASTTQKVWIASSGSELLSYAHLWFHPTLPEPCQNLNLSEWLDQILTQFWAPSLPRGAVPGTFCVLGMFWASVRECVLRTYLCDSCYCSTRRVALTKIKPGKEKRHNAVC